MRYPETAALIKKARTRKGLSQEKAARLVGCSRLQWINWERGRHRPELHVAALVEVVGVDGEKLKNADGAGDLDQDALDAALGRAVRAAVDRQIDARMKEYVG